MCRKHVGQLYEPMNICSFAGRDASLLDNKEEFNHNCSLFVGQADDLGCFKCPSCAKPLSRDPVLTKKNRNAGVHGERGSASL